MPVDLRAIAAIAAIAACHPAVGVPPPRPATCWFDRADGSTFELRADGDLVVLRRTGEAQRLARIGPTGAVAWEAPVDEPGTVELLAIDAHDDVLLVGEAKRAAEAVGDQPGCFVEKRSGHDGAARWTTRFTGTGYQDCRGIAVDAAGDAYAIGTFASTMTTPISVLASRGSSDIVVMRLAAADGAVRWVRTFGGANNDISRAIAVDRAGRVIVGGQFSGDGRPETGEVDFGVARLHAAGDFDAFLLALTPRGEPIWVRGFGDVGFDIVKSVAPDRDGNLYISGAWMRPADYHGQPPILTGIMDGFVARYGADGALAWRHVFTGGDGSQAHHVALDAVGRPWIVGHLKGTVDLGGRALAGTPGRSAAYAAGFTPTGEPTWAALVGAPGAEYAYRLAVAPDGALVVGGRGNGPALLCGALRDGAADGDDYIERFAPQLRRSALRDR